MEIKNMGNIKADKYVWKKQKEEKKPIYQISLSSLKKKMNNFAYLQTFLPFKEKENVYTFSPLELVSPLHFDIFAKYLYLKDKIEHLNNPFITKCYLHHIKAFNKFHEPDGTKNNQKDFLNAFQQLIEAVKKNTLNDTILLPISTQGILIEGSHRLACALYTNHPIQGVLFSVEDFYFNYDYFKKRHFSERESDFLALAIKDILPNVTCSIHPYKTKEEKESILKMLEEETDLYYAKSLQVNFDHLNLLTTTPYKEKQTIIFALHENPEWVHAITNKTKIHLFCTTFLNQNSIAFLNKQSKRKLLNLLSLCEKKKTHLIYQKQKEKLVSLKKPILSFAPNEIFYFNSICFLRKEK